MAGMGSKISLAPNLEQLLGETAGVKNAVQDVAEKILQVAKELVPVDTGALQGTGRVELDVSPGGFLVGRVIFGGGEVDYAVYVEFGTEDTPTFAFLRRAGESGVA